MVNKMSWKDTIRKKGKRTMSKNAIGLIEYVLTSEPQTLNEILEAMFEKGDEYVRNTMRIGSRNKIPPTSHRQRIPTRNELKYWLSRQPHIESAIFDKWTNKRISDKNWRNPSRVIKYWRS